MGSLDAMRSDSSSKAKNGKRMRMRFKWEREKEKMCKEIEREEGELLQK